MRNYYATHPDALERKRAKDRERYRANAEAAIQRQKEYYEEHREERKAYARQYSKGKRERRRAEAIAHLGGCCQGCGFDLPVGLQFHHRDPQEKLFEVGGAGLTKPEAVFWAEVEKCDLLCGTCHLIRHSQEGD